MLKTLVLTLSILAIIGVAFVSADNEQKVKIKTDITGKIVAVEMEKKAITVRDDVTGENVIYVFNDTTTFYRDGEVIEVKTLVPDETVTLKLAPKEKNVIVRLDTPIVVVEKEE
jgi:uncharacterized membrane protein